MMFCLRDALALKMHWNLLFPTWSRRYQQKVVCNISGTAWLPYQRPPPSLGCRPPGEQQQGKNAITVISLAKQVRAQMPPPSSVQSLRPHAFSKQANKRQLSKTTKTRRSKHRNEITNVSIHIYIHLAPGVCNLSARCTSPLPKPTMPKTHHAQNPPCPKPTMPVSPTTHIIKTGLNTVTPDASTISHLLVLISFLHTCPLHSTHASFCNRPSGRGYAQVQAQQTSTPLKPAGTHLHPVVICTCACHSPDSTYLPGPTVSQAAPANFWCCHDIEVWCRRLRYQTAGYYKSSQPIGGFGVHSIEEGETRR